MAKIRKKYQGPKYISKNPMRTFFGGMSDTHRSELQSTLAINHMAMQAMVQGRGDRTQWDRLVGAINVAIVMCEQGIGPEFRATLEAAREALLQCGIRGVKKGKFLFTGDELSAMNEALACHDAQMENVRAIDVDRAANEVIRRLNGRINTSSVMKEIRKGI